LQGSQAVQKQGPGAGGLQRLEAFKRFQARVLAPADLPPRKMEFRFFFLGLGATEERANVLQAALGISASGK
jgi:hypothetical protein